MLYCCVPPNNTFESVADPPAEEATAILYGPPALKGANATEKIPSEPVVAENWAPV